MHESLMLFESIVNSKTWLARSKFILCFTKMDIFERDIRNQLRSIDKFFPDYSGCPTDIEAGKAFFTAKFTGLLHTPRALDIYYINATDTGEVRLVLDNILNDRPTFPPHQTFVKLTDLDTIVE